MLFAALLVVATLITYVPAIDAGYVWDDDAHITANAALKSVDGLRRIWLEPLELPQYYPLVHTMFWMEYRLWGTNPFGFHLVNVLLHALNALLLWLVLRRLELPGAWLASAIFALHPVHVESVAWVTERKNVLSGLFYLLSVLALLRFFRVREQAIPVNAGPRRSNGEAEAPSTSEQRRAWGWYAAGMLLFLAALLSKTVTASLPVALLLVLWWKRDRLEWQEVVPLAPMLAVGAAFGFVTVWIERHHVWAEGEIWSLDFPGRLLVAGRALWFYAWKLAWPAKLAFFYSRWAVDPRVWWQWLFPVAALGAVLALWMTRRRIGKGPLAAVLVFVVTLAPALGFFDVFPMRYSWVADHFQYLASAALIALFAATLTGSGVAPAAWRRGMTGLILTVLGVLTWRHALAYKDAETLWRDTISKEPGSWAARCNLGNILVQRGDTREATAQYEEALRLNPRSIEAHNNLGTILYKQDRTEEAAAHFAEAVRLEGHFVVARLHLASALIRMDRNGEAIEQFELILHDQPSLIPAHQQLAQALEREGRTQEAIEERAEVFRLEAWVRATHEIAALRSGTEAIGLAEKACWLTGYSQARALDTLGAAYAEAGRFPEAIETARKALSIIATTGGQGDLAEGIAQRLHAYGAGRPWRDSSLSKAYGNQ